MKIGIFGGAFNPPHIGHVHAAKTAAEQYEVDLLIVIPTGTPSHKNFPGGTPDPEMRLTMTKNAFDGICNVKISDIEVYSQDNNYTIDTVRKLQLEYANAEFLLLVGNDMYDSLDTWKNSEELLKIVTPVLLSRTIINISSSELREMLPKRRGREFLADLNYTYIIKNRLYNARPDWEWLREQAHSMLSPLRIPHVKACESEAVDLAKRWGVSTDDAREAAILHDITKKLDFSQNMCIIAKHGLTASISGINEEKLLHSITGALVALSDYGVSNNVAEAIKWHTTGRAGMSMLDKVIYIADYIEATRDFPGVRKLRNIAYNDINEAMKIGLEMTVNDLKTRGITPNVSTLDALEEFKG